MDTKIVEEQNEYLKEPKDGLITYGPEVVAAMRKEFNFVKREDRDNAYAVIKEWIKQQDHIVKKDFTQDYIERCLGTSKGSIERAKKQIDKMCTFRTLMPQYFQVIDIKKTEIMDGLDNLANICIVPKLTKEHYRIIVVKMKPNVVTTNSSIVLLYKLLIIMGEYFKANDCCRGYIIVYDYMDANFADLLSKISFTDLQQFLPILTEGYGCKIKGIYMVTASKIFENFLKIFQQLFSAKIAGRLRCVSQREALKHLINGDVLPEEYGGPEKPVKELQERMVDVLSGDKMKNLLREMNKAVTDESKRHIYDFNDKCMGMPGTFRTLSLD